jgi:hypothetical protein
MVAIKSVAHFSLPVRDAALPVQQNTRQGREGGALPKPFFRGSPVRPFCWMISRDAGGARQTRTARLFQYQGGLSLPALVHHLCRRRNW